MLTTKKNKDAKCLFCGSPVDDRDGCTNPNCNINRPSAPSQSGGISGWICPRCGRGLSPFTSVCPCLPITNYPGIGWPVPRGPWCGPPKSGTFQ